MDNIQSTFINEAEELIQELDVALLTLENNPMDNAGVEHVFRTMHTLKGNSKMFDFLMMADTVHDLETLYEDIRSGKRGITKELLNCSFAALDHLKAILIDPECSEPVNAENHRKLMVRIKSLGNEEADSGTSLSNVSSSEKTYHIFFRPNENFLSDGSNPLYILSDLAGLGKVLMVPHFSKPEEYKPVFCYTYWDIFIETASSEKDLREVFVFAESNSDIQISALEYAGLTTSPRFGKVVMASKFNDEPLDPASIAQWASEFGESIVSEEEDDSSQSQVKKISDKNLTSVRVGSEKLEELMNLVSELITTQASLSLFAEQNELLELESITEIFEKLSRRLRDVAFGMTLIPINNLFNRFQRMVRDISGELGKEVKLISQGGETELDKNIIESLADPLMHIIRNSVDHGIELPAEREKKGKDKAGKVTLKAYYSGVFVYIQIIDDGKGIDVDRVRSKAIEKGIIDPEAELSDQEIFELIFHPGFSTANEVTDISGRGVGMDVVQKSITSLRGSIKIDSEKDKGSVMTIKLPLTLSVIDGLLVKIGNDQYLLPLAVVEKCYEVQNSTLISNFNELLVLDGEQYPFINMRGEFGEDLDPEGMSQVILVRHNDKYVALTIDYIIGEYQAVVKPLGKYFQGQDFVSGATILGDGSIALILDSHKMVDQYVDHRQNQKLAV